MDMFSIVESAEIRQRQIVFVYGIMTPDED